MVKNSQDAGQFDSPDTEDAILAAGELYELMTGDKLVDGKPSPESSYTTFPELQALQIEFAELLTQLQVVEPQDREKILIAIEVDWMKKLYSLLQCIKDEPNDDKANSFALMIFTYINDDILRHLDQKGGPDGFQLSLKKFEIQLTLSLRNRSMLGYLMGQMAIR